MIFKGIEIYSQSSSRIDNLVELNKSEARTCDMCGKLFVPQGRNKSRQKSCDRVHFSYCSNCGKVIIQWHDAPRKSCSKECANAMRIKSMQSTLQSMYGEGILNSSQVPEIHAKQVESANAKREQIETSRRRTMLERYGVEHPIQNKEIRAKIDKTNLDRYGSRNVSHNPEICKKISESLKRSDVIEAKKECSLVRWGTEYPAQSEEVQYRMRKTCMERYGVEYPTSIPEIEAKCISTCIERYGVPCGFLKEGSAEKARISILSSDNKGKISKLNQRIADYLKENYSISTEFEKIINNKWYDLHVIDSNILIEIDPTYTHSSQPSHWGYGLSSSYHLSKTNIAAENGYRCIHIFDWDNIDSIATMICPKTIIYARNCTISEIDKSTASDFLDRYHIQKKSNGVVASYGLFYESQLVQVATFGKPRYNKNYEWELLRLASKGNYAVVGGASKLFQKFIKDINPNSVISYCDRSKFSGEVYYKLGFNLHHTSSPAKIWSKGSKHITDNLLRQRGYDQLFGTSYGKGTSNEELMIANGWRDVYDCGQYVFEWINSKRQCRGLS